MDLKLLKQLFELMQASDVSEFEIEEEDLKLKLRRGHADSPGAGNPHILVPAQAAPAAAVSGAPGDKGGTQDAVAEDSGLLLIKSPMVGTFYRAANPDSAAFVSEGSKISPESVVCIIEAMKVMNEIQAEVKGTVTEILVENGQAVEYGQPLFKVKAD